MYENWLGIPKLVPYFGSGHRNFTFTFHFHALEKEMATHSSVLAWRIPGTVEPGGLLSMGSQRVRHDWSDLAATAAAAAWKLNDHYCQCFVFVVKVFKVSWINFIITRLDIFNNLIDMYKLPISSSFVNLNYFRT